MSPTTIKNIIKTGITYFTWAIATTLFYPIFLPQVLLPKRIRYKNRLFYVTATIFSWILVKSTFLRVTTHGKENLPTYPNSPAIIVMNHASSIDIPLGQIVAGSYPHTWIGHARYGNVPILGILFKNMHVSLKKMSGSDGRSALLTLYNAIKDSPRHALIFPEGTRHADGTVHEFYQGFAMLAQKLNRPVIPVFINNMHTIYPKERYTIDSSNNHVKIIVGQPVYLKQDQETEDFVKQIHTWFVEQSNDKK